MYLYALGTSGYAHNRGSLILKNDDTTDTLAAEALVSLGLWMYVVKLLHDSVKDCKQNEESIVSSSRSLFNNGNGKHIADKAAALWIGCEQIPGEKDSGHLLYSLTEKMGEVFGTKVNGQAKANSEVLRLLRSASSVFSFHNACTKGSNSYKALRILVDSTLSEMYDAISECGMFRQIYFVFNLY